MIYSLGITCCQFRPRTIKFGFRSLDDDDDDVDTNSFQTLKPSIKFFDGCVGVKKEKEDGGAFSLKSSFRNSFCRETPKAADADADADDAAAAVATLSASDKHEDGGYFRGRNEDEKKRHKHID